MKRKNINKQGFTIIELLIATLAFSILMLAVGSMLVFGWQGWYRYSDSVSMQGDAALATQMIAKEIRNASYVDISDGAGISFANSGISFSESGNNLVRSDGMIVVNGWLVPGTFVTRKLELATSQTRFKTNQWVEVGFSLRTTTQREAYSIQVSPRN